MWDDIVIGTGDKGNSAIKTFAVDGDHGISENRVSYWISDCYLDIGMTIFKNTEAGIRLTDMIEKRAPLSVIQSWLNALALTHIDETTLKKKINQAIKKAYDEGSSDRAAAIRASLGVLR